MKRIWSILLLPLSLAACNSRDSSPIPSASAATKTTPPPPSATPAPAPVAQCNPGCLSIEKCEGGKCVPACPAGEVYIPATGPDGFKMGRGAPGAGDRKHTVILSKPFCMDSTEVTVASYRACVSSGKCTVPQLRDINANYRDEYHRDDHPVNMVNFAQATNYCATHGQALPSEAQFEWAAGHGDGRKYPWGNEDPTCENELADFTPGGSPHLDPAGDVGCHGGGTSPVKSHPKGKSSWPNGDLYDLGGNLWEWTADCYVPYPLGPVTDPSPQEHPSLRGDCYVRSLRGGGWNRSKNALEVSWRAASKRTYRVPGLGFRCVRNPS